MIGNNVLEVKVNQPGDFSTYTFRLVRDRADDCSLQELRSILSAIKSPSSQLSKRFSIAKEGSARRSCILNLRSATWQRTMASFKQLMLDRISALVPTGESVTQRDLGVALVELLAYLGIISAINRTPLLTKRIWDGRKGSQCEGMCGVVDYFLHEGCNARVFVQSGSMPMQIRSIKGWEGKPPSISQRCRIFRPASISTPLSTPQPWYRSRDLTSS